MKKLIVFLLTAALLAVLSVPALAVTNDGTENTGITVKGEYIPAPSSVTVSVEVAWEELNFTYQDGDKTWDPARHEEVAGEGAWEDTTKTVTVTNHSNTAIRAVLSFDTTVENLTGHFDKTELVLPTAENTAYAEAPTASAAFGLSGGRITADQKVGTITIRIEAVTVVSTVSTEAELLAAVKNDGTYTLSGNITLTAPLVVEKAVTLNLAGYTISGETLVYLLSVAGGNLTVQNGTLSLISTGNMLINVGPAAGALTLENCVLEINHNRALRIHADCTVTLRDCTTTGTGGIGGEFAYMLGVCSLVMSGNTTKVGDIECEDGTVTCLAGVYNFDPTGYVDAAAYTVADNGDGTWTVAAK